MKAEVEAAEVTLGIEVAEVGIAISEVVGVGVM